MTGKLNKKKINIVSVKRNLTRNFILKILSCVFGNTLSFSSLSAELLSPMVPPATTCVLHMIICLIPYDGKCGVRWELDRCLSGGGRGRVPDWHLIRAKKNATSRVSISFAALIKGAITMSYLWLCLLPQGRRVFVGDGSASTVEKGLGNETHALCVTVAQPSWTTLTTAPSN